MKKLLVVLVIMSILSSVGTTEAKTLNRAIICFTFDDGLSSTYNVARPMLAAKNMPATVYIVPSYVGGDASHMTWPQIQDLYWRYNWEIGNHSFYHRHWASFTDAQILSDIKAAQNAMVAYGINWSGAFTPPFGDMYDYTAYPGLYERARTLLIKTGYLTSSRVPWDDTDIYNIPATFDQWKMNSYKLVNPRTFTQAKSVIDTAVTNKEALFITSHGVATATTEVDGLNTATLQAVINYVATQLTAGKVDVMTVSKAVSKIKYYKSLP